MPSKKTKRKHPALAKAIEITGSQQALADLLGCNQSAISKRLYGVVPITAEWAVEVEQALGCKVTRNEFRPDLWG